MNDGVDAKVDARARVHWGSVRVGVRVGVRVRAWVGARVNIRGWDMG